MFIGIFNYLRLPLKYCDFILSIGFFLGIFLRIFVLKIIFYIIPVFKYLLLPFGFIIFNTGFSISSFQVVYNSNYINTNKYVLLFKIFTSLLFIEIIDLFCTIDSLPVVLLITSNSFIIFFCSLLSVLFFRFIFFSFYNTLSNYSGLKYFIKYVLTFLGFKILLIFTNFNFDNNFFYLFFFFYLLSFFARILS